MKITIKEIFFYCIAALFVIGYFVLLFVILNKNIPEGNMQIALLLFGTLTGGVMTILNYFFGTSLSSAQKNEMLLKAGGYTPLIDNTNPIPPDGGSGVK